MIGGSGRERQIRQANQWLEAISDDMSNISVVQAAGQLHLTAALAHASMLDADGAWGHLAEADSLACRLDSEVGDFGYMWFGRTNAAFWRVSLMVELNEGRRLPSTIDHISPETMPDRGRQAQFYSDYGRALAQRKSTREKGVRLLRHAEDLAPQLIRNNPLVREAALHLLGTKLPANAEREVRGIAYRTGAHV